LSGDAKRTEPADAEGLIGALATAVGGAPVGLDPPPLAAGVVDPQPVTMTGARESVRARLRRSPVAIA